MVYTQHFWSSPSKSQESGDPEQIKAALEEAKRAGADEVPSSHGDDLNGHGRGISSDIYISIYLSIYLSMYETMPYTHTYK